MRMFGGWFSVIKMATVLEGCATEEQRSVVHSFCGRKDSIQRSFIEKCFLFTVGSVYRVKRFTTGSRNVVYVSLMTKRLKQTEVRKWLRQESKDLKVRQCWLRICQEMHLFFPRFEYHRCYVWYTFVTYLLTLPRMWLCIIGLLIYRYYKLNIRIFPRLFKHHGIKTIKEIRDLLIFNLGTRRRWVSSLLYGRFTLRK
jgi:hypothetical protein